MAKKQKMSERSTDELKSQLDVARREVREARFQYGLTRTVENPGRLRTAKRDIARVLTILHERSKKAQ